ncbi:YgaP family membrane protein [Rubellimicrobium roseum]|uniref:DUF2892 domain-containing protein n=1 Tax=Rubellimicrobium roseum TaxID=687525 RepID=A0A5C4N9W4_9RHOB|nr:DUF2892 domain-containing protein [Rubellimicrobium roseum]TNC71403.1 DUF2892 domain-containing protein [Rubellimicrobium roseum]
MFKSNVGTVDRVLRVILGIALLLAFILNPGSEWRWLFLIGVVPLVTGLVGSCPVYTLLGFSTCPMRR